MRRCIFSLIILAVSSVSSPGALRYSSTKDMLVDFVDENAAIHHEQNPPQSVHVPDTGRPDRKDFEGEHINAKQPTVSLQYGASGNGEQVALGHMHEVTADTLAESQINTDEEANLYNDARTQILHAFDNWRAISGKKTARAFDDLEDLCRDPAWGLRLVADRRLLVTVYMAAVIDPLWPYPWTLWATRLLSTALENNSSAVDLFEEFVKGTQPGQKHQTFQELQHRRDGLRRRMWTLEGSGRGDGEERQRAREDTEGLEEQVAHLDRYRSWKWMMGLTDPSSLFSDERFGSRDWQRRYASSQETRELIDRYVHLQTERIRWMSAVLSSDFFLVEFVSGGALGGLEASVREYTPGLNETYASPYRREAATLVADHIIADPAARCRFVSIHEPSEACNPGALDYQYSITRCSPGLALRRAFAGRVEWCRFLNAAFTIWSEVAQSGDSRGAEHMDRWRFVPPQCDARSYHVPSGTLLPSCVRRLKLCMDRLGAWMTGARHWVDSLRM